MYTETMVIDLAQYQELYLQTSRDLINVMKEQLVSLSKKMDDSHAIEEFHRAAHSLKSQSLVMGYQQLGIVNRQLEAFFLRIKEKELVINQEYLDMLETITNHIENAVQDIDTSEHEPDLKADIERLKQHTNIEN